MINVYKKFWQYAFTCEGRTRRKDFWLGALLNIICLIIMAIIAALVFAHMENGKVLYDIVFYIFYVVLAIPMFSISVRRFHDIGKGKTIPIIYLVLTLLSPIYQISEDYKWISQISDSNVALLITIAIVSIILTIASIVISIMALVYCVKDSEEGTNQYGPNPKKVKNKGD